MNTGYQDKHGNNILTTSTVRIDNNPPYYVIYEGNEYYLDNDRGRGELYKFHRVCEVIAC